MRWSAADTLDMPHPFSRCITATLVMTAALLSSATAGRLEDGLRSLAEQGNAVAQTALGDRYDEGQGVLQDYVEAVKWYRKAAEQGNADAQDALARMYVQGQGVPKDLVQAHMWFNLAASRFSGEGLNIDAAARDSLAAEMTPAQIEQAQRLAREWRPK
jgi:TPR repeat protein